MPRNATLTGSWVWDEVTEKLSPLIIWRMQVVYGHLDDPEKQELKRGVSYLRLRPGELDSGSVAFVFLLHGMRHVL